MNALKLGRVALILALTAAFAALSLVASAQATPPGRVNYQGVVRDAAGVPLNGSVTMTFKFFDDPTAGTLLWEEIYDSGAYTPQVTVTGGLFTVVLGDTVHRNGGNEPLFTGIFANHTDVYLAVKISTDAEMTPRIKVVSAPFAENCDTLDGKHASDFLDASSSENFLNTSSTPQTKAGTLTLTSTVDYGIDASGLSAGGWFKDNDSSGQSFLAWNDCGIRAIGSLAGGVFQDTNSSGYANVGIGDCGIDANGNNMGGHFQDMDNSGYANVGYGDLGIDARGNSTGGSFADSNSSGCANVGKGDHGIEAYGNNAGGYFEDLDSSGYAYVGVTDYGIQGYGTDGGGYFIDPVGGGYGIVGYDNYGVAGWGSFAGGHFDDTNSADWADVSYSTYKIFGTGDVSFVQNHPTEKDKVIVYACPEGDEVATYTRGTAKLVNGEARVTLGETFQWVTNPDIGLTAHLTAHGKAVALGVKSLSTTELVVTGTEDVSFDYLVYGLRIGFEESSIVQEKQRESFIPSFKDHRERYAKYPDLRAFNALERFKTMESSVRGMSPEALDLSRAAALKGAIHEYDPATDPPVEKLFGHGPGRAEEPAQTSERPAPRMTPPISPPILPSARPAFPESDQPEAGVAAILEPPPVHPCLPVSEAVEPGDVVVMDSANEKHVVRCAMPADPLVVGIAAGRGEECRRIGLEEVSAQVPVATSGIVPCKVDAGFGPIRRGDLLVASPNPGHAMRAVDSTPGTILGKALEPLASGSGPIKVLVMLR